MKNSVKIWLGGCAIIIIAILIGLVFFSLAGKYLVRKDKLKSSDALVILSGGKGERLEFGAKLYEDGIARRIILTETDEVDPITNEQIIISNFNILASEYGISKVRIIATKKTSTSTYEEALAVLAVVKDREWKSLVVVTDSFHSRRTGMIFDKVFRGSGVRVSIQPVDVPGYWYRPLRWWWTGESREATFLEYVKILYFLAGQNK
jgi:uncharacterized SAM-binding protein YcdF (DUF218 family)